MATNLYETLDISRNATPAQIRKAYKQKALQTHPDRLPAGASPAEKAASEEHFRRVNNAYEILNDPQNRRAYDKHGVFPPPTPGYDAPPNRDYGGHHGAYSHHHYTPRHHTFLDPFSRGHYGPPFSFVFTDPFVLFDSIFGEFAPRHHAPQYRHHHYSASSEDPFQRAYRVHSEMGTFMADVQRSMFSGGFLGLPSPRIFPTIESSQFSDNSHGRWAGESVMTTSINGVTQTVRKKRDWDGNEHVTRTYPDGREVYTVNGIEQPQASRGYLPPQTGSSESRRLPPPPPAVGQPQIGGTSSDYVPPPPPYPGHTGGYNAAPAAESNYKQRGRRYSDARPVNPNLHAPAPGPEDDQHDNRSQHHHRKTGWRGGW